MSFPRQLRRLRRLMRTARLGAAVTASAGLAALLLLALGLLDAAAAFEPGARATAVALVLVTAAAVALGLVVRALRVSAAVAARRADALLDSGRSPASAALSLDPATAETPLARWLTERTMADAAAALTRLPARQIPAWRPLVAGAVVLATAALAILLLRATFPQPFAVGLQRLLHPRTDIPPYSPLRFTIEPATPSVVYGGEILLTATITGGVPEQAVECLVRNSRTGAILRLPAFRETPTRFSRNLDNRTEPVEIAFATGRARSAWTPVEVLYEPNILGGLVRVAPPEYTGLPATEFPLDTNEISAVEGSAVSLELTSNRPLAGGALTFSAATTPGEAPQTTTLEGDSASAHSVSFGWTATRTGRLAATVRDLRGTPSARPLELTFRCIPDQAPEVTLDSPPTMLLATPASKIPVVGRARDDFALARVHFVRTLAGFRDRPRLVAPSLSSTSYDFRETLDLEELGLEAGQTIELMLDAADHNPSLLGQGASEIARIHVISEEQYAAHIRARTTIEQFEARFDALRDAVNQARKALDELENAAPDDRAEALDQARDAHRRAAELLDRLADDFPAFDLEQQLKDLAREQAGDLRENLRDLENIDPAIPDDELARRLDPMRDRLGRQREQAGQLDDRARLAIEAIRLLEMAARFRRIYENQANLAKRFATIVEELRRGLDDNRRQLPSLGETQRKNRESLDEFKAELRRRIDALPDDQPELEELAASAANFLLELEVAEPETLMDAATRHAGDGRAAEALENAELARAALERLLSQNEDFPNAARGEAPRFEVPDLDLTMRQFLDGLLERNLGGGDGAPNPGGQPGPGLGMNQGFAGGGFPMNLPMIGPDRLEFQPQAGPNAGGGSGDGAGATAPPLPDTAETGQLAPTEPQRQTSAAPSPESIPEPYREAVGKFLTP